MRKALAVLALAGLLLALPGCSSLMNGERASSTPHKSADRPEPGQGEAQREASDYDELFQALTGFIHSGTEHGVIRMTGYQGDPEADLESAVLTAANSTPEGAYCVYYINYSLINLVSMYEANISVIYRHTPEEAAAARSVENEEELHAVLKESIEARASVVALRLSGVDIAPEDIERCVESVYYENPGTILYIPTCAVSSYPEEGEERILELRLSYPYATSTATTRRNNLEKRAEEIIAADDGADVTEQLLWLGNFFKENVRFDESVNTSDRQARRYSAMTAYGALIQGSAVGEGYAMAAKLLCDKLGIPCIVVRGRLDNMDHAWNIVTLEGGQYHMDLSRFDPEGAVFRNDAQQEYYNYWWDRDEYPACAFPSLYGPEYDPPAGEDEPGPAQGDTPAHPENPDAGEQPGEENPGAGEPVPEEPGGEDAPDDPANPEETPDPDAPDAPDAPEPPENPEEGGIAPPSPQDPQNREENRDGGE